MRFSRIPYSITSLNTNHKTSSGRSRIEAITRLKRNARKFFIVDNSFIMDCSAYVTYINSKKTNYAAIKDQCTAQITQLEACGLSDVVGPQILSLTYKVGDLTKEIQRCDALLAEINAIRDLSADDTTKLTQFCELCSDRCWTQRMPFNFTRMIADITPVLSAPITLEQKQLVAKNLCVTYPIRTC